MENKKQLAKLNEYASNLINNVLSHNTYTLIKIAINKCYYDESINQCIININKHAKALKKANDWNDAQKEICSIVTLCSTIYNSLQCEF